MTNIDKQIGYNLNEQDINAILRYVQLNNPEYTTP